MYSCTKILICLTVTCSLDKISKVFHARLVNIDLWWVVVYIAGAGVSTIINANVFTRSWEADDSGEWWRMVGGIFKPQDTRLLEDRCRGWQEKKQTNNPLNASLKWNNCMHTVFREEDNVVGEDPSVQGELCELQLQILTGLWSAGWNTKLAGVVSESQGGYQGSQAEFIPGKLTNPLWLTLIGWWIELWPYQGRFKAVFFIFLLFFFDTSFCKNLDFLVQIRLTVKLIDDLRHPFLRLNGVDHSVFIIHGIDNAHVIVVVPNWEQKQTDWAGWVFAFCGCLGCEHERLSSPWLWKVKRPAVSVFLARWVILQQLFSALQKIKSWQFTL